MASVQHTCTGCVPIDASIIEVYIRLLGAKTSANAAAERAEYAAEHAIGKSPYIGANGNWWEWNDERGEFIDTMVQARGQIAVDTQLDPNSTNPVQNKVTAEELAKKQEKLVSGENIKTVGGQSLVGPGDIEVGDKNAVKFVSQELTDQQKNQARTNIGAYQKPSSGIPASDIAAGVIPDISGKQDTIQDLPTIRAGAALGATALQSFTEADPTVPAWAKASTKPTYTAAEVGALPSTTLIPTKTSDLTNDSGFIHLGATLETL